MLMSAAATAAARHVVAPPSSSRRSIDDEVGDDDEGEEHVFGHRPTMRNLRLQNCDALLMPYTVFRFTIQTGVGGYPVVVCRPAVGIAPCPAAVVVHAC
jgi:hypothetical protein